ncbi:MBOAT family protein [Selenomonas sp. oral taxon 138]|uniref:MBOAT family O-acyltransferase n=1 Tax=Selenomonas sp. oral taxon 138 TaxID=712532 RepID=UPI0002A3E1CE|nr:MBOAT family O-acyltransferase [Selenomonas sp. oral taxon 138]EKY01384.1 alginate O-acetyltransferase AlgI family protein [Selenomonas sp. oral taxon 138 str. F0429]
MLFNSYEFLFLFLPIAVGGYFFLGNREKTSEWANIWLVGLSLFFYSYWDIKYLPLLLLSIGFNYVISGYIIRYRKEKQKKNAKTMFLLGIIFNAGLLGFFKYTDFFLENLNYLGAQFPLLHIILPLGISFFTITQMVYLVDCYEGVAKERNLIHYALFVSFFPHLLAGPILYHRPMMKQFKDATLRRVDWDNMGRGLSLFIIGLAKKVLIADSFVTVVAKGFAHPEQLTLVDSWTVAICYMMQLYFDFSGYSDMAVGIARMMNINIPINFDAPYRAYGIINFWQRWHMSLTTTITNYLYTPMVMVCKKITFGKAMAATFASMFIAGIWHGAGWTYIIFGSLHGLGLVLNHTWKKYHLWMWKPLGYVLTLGLVLVAFVFFRAESVTDALQVLYAMVGGNGVLLPPAVATFMNGNFDTNLMALSEYDVPRKTLVVLLLVVFCPSSNNIIKKLQPNYKWAVVLAALFSYGIASLSQMTEFLYFQF